jgi:twitching motility protein PilT
VALVDSLLTAIVRADGEALVMHVGERPYVVAPSGQAELSSRTLTLEAMAGMLTQLLPAESRHALEEVGAVQYDLAPSTAAQTDNFTVVAARGGDDIWIEIRRHKPRAEPIALVEAPEPADASPLAEPVAPEEPAAEREAEPLPSPVPLATGNSEQVVRLRPVDASTARAATPWSPSISPEPQPAVVLPLARNHIRGDQTARISLSSRVAGIDRLLRIAAARGASTLYLVSHARPAIRVDGEISVIDGEAPLSESEVESLILDIMPERNRQALRSDVGTEWICDAPDVGRVRCLSFRDHRGAGGIFRMIPARAISVEQLGLAREIQGLCAEPEGLVLVTGLRSSGRSTLISAFVDLINRTRSVHVVTLESEIKFVHESRGALVSQREVRGDNDELLMVVRSALRENPDVLVIEDLRSPEIVTVALEAAQSGHLVIGALTAHTATAAVDRIIDQTAPERRPKIQLALAEALRGIVAQVLLRKSGGGRVAAREVLLNTSAVATLIAEGKTSQLPMAIDSGRKHGMVPLNDALAAFVQSGTVDSREAYRLAFDRQGFLNLLKRQGIDTSFVERLA